MKVNNKKIKILKILFVILVLTIFINSVKGETEDPKIINGMFVIEYPGSIQTGYVPQKLVLTKDTFLLLGDWKELKNVQILNAKEEDGYWQNRNPDYVALKTIMDSNSVTLEIKPQSDRLVKEIKDNDGITIAKLDISDKIEFKSIAGFNTKDFSWGATLYSDGKEIEGSIQEKKFTSKDGSLIVEELQEGWRIGLYGEQLGEEQIKKIKKEDGFVSYAEVLKNNGETEKLDINKDLKVQDIGLEESKAGDKWSAIIEDGTIGYIEDENTFVYADYKDEYGNDADFRIKIVEKDGEEIVQKIEKSDNSHLIWENNNLAYSQIRGKELHDIPKEFSIDSIKLEGGIYTVVRNDRTTGTLNNNGKTYISDDKLHSLEDLGNNQIRETTIDPDTKVETIILSENNNIFFYKKEDIGLSFHKDMQVKSVDDEDGILVTLSDGKEYNVEEEGKKLVSISGLLKIEAIKNPDGSTTIRKTSKDRETLDETILELKEGKVILYSDKEGEVKFDIPVNPNIVEGIVKAERGGNKVEIDENGEGYEILDAPAPIEEVLIQKEIKAPVSWKIIDSDIDGGTTTITYGEGKSVTMRTEMLDNIKLDLNMIEDFDEIKVEGNILTYTLKGEDLYNAVIEFNEDGKLKSKTYTWKNLDELITAQTIYEFDENGEIKLEVYIKRNEDGTYTKTETRRNADRTYTTRTTILDKDGNPITQLETEIVGKAGVGASVEGSFSIDTDEIWSNKIGIKLKNVYEEDGVLHATLEDGSKGTLSEKENKFIYDDSGDGVIHTLQAIEGESLLEYYKDESEDYGTIKISIDKGNDEKETIIFEGIYDENKKIIKKGDKLIVEIDEDGRILTDFNKKGEAQTIHYPASNKFFGTYVFGRTQKDGSEKIYFPGYVPVAFRTESGDLVIIRTDKDGNRIYTNNKGKELSENSAGVKEAKAMVTKSLIGPAFYSAVEGARGGRALSNLLNTWLDWDFMMGWRKTTDEFFSQTVIGRIISGKWEESVCHKHIDKIPNNIAVVNVNNIMGFAAHVEGERSAAIITNNETLYFYKITFGINPKSEEDIEFELLIDGNKADLDGDGTADKIEIKAGESYSGTGENAIVRYKDEIYKKVCLKFYDTENLNAEFRNSLKDDKLCNNIVEAYISPGEVSEPTSSTTASGTSADGW